MSKYFPIKELTASTVARANGIDNEPPMEVRLKLSKFITKCLDPLREACGFPITVTSGYRCATLNAKVGGKPTSQHTKGEAADLVGRNDKETRRIFEVAKELNNHDQLLFERNSKGSTWVHISWKSEGNRLQTIDNYKA